MAAPGAGASRRSAACRSHNSTAAHARVSPHRLPPPLLRNPSRLRRCRPLRGSGGVGRGKRRDPPVPGAVLPSRPGLRRRRGHVLVRLPRGRVRRRPRGAARVLRGRGRVGARLRPGAAARPHRLALRARRRRPPRLPLMSPPLTETVTTPPRL